MAYGQGSPTPPALRTAAQITQALEASSLGETPAQRAMSPMGRETASDTAVAAPPGSKRRLEQVLSELPSTFSLLLEFKTHDQDLAKRVAEMVQQSGRSDNVLWFSLSSKTNAMLRTVAPFPTVSSSLEVVWAYVLFLCGLALKWELIISRRRSPKFKKEFKNLK